MTEEQYELEQEYNKECYPSPDEETTLISIAIVKGRAYSQEYNPTLGRVEDKKGHWYLKEGYTDGFLAGVAYQFTGDSND